MWRIVEGLDDKLLEYSEILLEYLGMHLNLLLGVSGCSHLTSQCANLEMESLDC
jgi:hypothetical protein